MTMMMHMHTLMCVLGRVCTCTCMHAMYIYYVRELLYIFSREHELARLCTYICFVCVSVCVCVCMCVCVSVCVCV